MTLQSPQSDNRPFRRFVLFMLVLALLVVMTAYGWHQHTLQSLHIASEFLPHLPPRAIKYQRESRFIQLGDILWNLVGISSILTPFILKSFISITNRLSTIMRVRSVQSPALLEVVVMLLLIAMYLWIWSLPFSILTLLHERRYHFSTTSVSTFLRDAALGITSSTLVAPVFWAGFRLRTKFANNWWRIVWVGCIPLFLCVTVLQPVIIAPLFNGYHYLSKSPLKDRIVSLCRLSGIKNSDVMVEDTSRRTLRVNAYVTGIGPSARIVITDNALRLLPDDQLLAMIGHELGHYVHQDVLASGIIGCLGIGGYLWMLNFGLQRKQNCSEEAESLQNLGLIPAVQVSIAVFLLIQSPVDSCISRWHEWRADDYGLETTRLYVPTAKLMIGFAERDYIDPDPPPILQFWFGTHPTVLERIDHALSFDRPLQTKKYNR